MLWWRPFERGFRAAALMAGCVACASPQSMGTPARCSCPGSASPDVPGERGVPASARAHDAEPALAQRAVEVVRQVHGPNWRSVYRSFSEPFRRAVPEPAFGAVLADLEKGLGELSDVRLLEQEDHGSLATFHLAAFFARGTRKYQATLDEQGVVQGLVVTTFAPNAEIPSHGPADDYVTERLYRFPCHGQWHIGNGGRDPALNHHVGNVQQWYAYDLVRKDPATAKTYRGEGRRKEDYLAWGEPVLAPADGTVIQVIDSIVDHGVEHTDRYFLTGNLVSIAHGDDEYSFIAHLRQGSIVVKPGQRVKQGQLLGKTGNSGNSSEPHIHWHLATDPDISRGHGLPIRLQPMIVDGKLVDTPEPVRGQAIEL